MHASEGSSLVVMHAEFVENSAHNGSDWVVAGAVNMGYSSSLNVTACSFYRNSANNSGYCASRLFPFGAYGGAVAVQNGSTGELSNTALQDNAAFVGPPPGRSLCISSEQYVQGGAVYVYKNSTLRLIDVRADGNTVEGSGSAGAVEGGACYTIL